MNPLLESFSIFVIGIMSQLTQAEQHVACLVAQRQPHFDICARSCFAASSKRVSNFSDHDR